MERHGIPKARQPEQANKMLCIYLLQMHDSSFYSLTSNINCRRDERLVCLYGAKILLEKLLQHGMSSGEIIGGEIFFSVLGFSQKSKPGEDLVTTQYNQFYIFAYMSPSIFVQ